MLFKGNKLLLFESKERTQPACISARQIDPATHSMLHVPGMSLKNRESSRTARAWLLCPHSAHGVLSQFISAGNMDSQRTLSSLN